MTHFSEKLNKGEPTLSFEFFPPKTPKGWVTLYSTLAELSYLNPDFISVTYGAGGSTRQKTLGLVERIQSELKIESMAHLTCVGHSQTEIAAILKDLEKSEIKNVIALRGDPPKGQTEFKAHANGFSHASELIEYMSQNFSFNIAAACYPEKHIEAESLESDIQYLKLKQDMGAHFAITQLFFDNDDFYRFRDKAVAAGVNIPIIAGVMPVTSLSQLERFKDMAGATIPPKLIQHLNKHNDVISLGVEYGVQQCMDLIKNDTSGLHLYTLNKSDSSMRITKELQNKGLFESQLENKKA